jgi:Cdc6-like AAA superfamily ATPase
MNAVVMAAKKRADSAYSAFQDAVKGKAFDMRFPENFKIIVAGASGTGKTETCRRLLEHADEMMVKKPKIIYFFYMMWQDNYEVMKSKIDIPIKFIRGAPSDDTLDEIINHPLKGCTIILDDMQLHLSRSIVNLFQVQARHNKISLILLIQSLFDRSSPNLRDISLSATHFILTKSPRDQTQVSISSLSTS